MKFLKQEASTKGNVMTPLNYGTVIMQTLGGFTTIFTDDPIIKYGAFGFCICWGIYYACKYDFWSKKDPDRLQSESFLLQAQALGLGKDSSGSASKTVEINPDELQKLSDSSSSSRSTKLK